MLPLLILSGSEVSSPSACPSAVHCPPVEVSLPCLSVHSGGGLCPFCKLVTPRCISQFSSFEVYICVCVVCLCSNVCTLVHAHVYGHGNQRSVLNIFFCCFPPLFLFIYAFETGFLTKPRAHQLCPTGYRTNSKDSFIYSAPVLELQIHAPHGVCHGC